MAKLRPSGHDISDKFGNDRGGAIPPNILDDSDEYTLMGDPILIANETDINTSIHPVNVISASNTASNDYYQKDVRI